MMQDDDGRLVEIVRNAINEKGLLEPSIELARAALAAIEREGWKVVPVEATADMCGEAGSVPDRPIAGYMARLWDAFLSAAPKQG